MHLTTYYPEVLQSNHWESYLFKWILVEQRVKDFTPINQTATWLFSSSKGCQAVAYTGRTVIYELTTDSRAASRDRWMEAPPWKD